MGVVDWRAWVAQSGGTLPTAPNPPGTPWQNNQVFPGVGPITDTIDGTVSVPPYPNVPTTVKPYDPFWVGGTPPTGQGWNAQLERAPGYLMRPVVPGITS